MLRVIICFQVEYWKNGTISAEILFFPKFIFSKFFQFAFNIDFIPSLQILLLSK
jgi:hypothetical protein